MKKNVIVFLLICICPFFMGVKYYSVKDAVEHFTGKGLKMFQKSYKLTPEMKQQMKKDLNWTPVNGGFKFYYSRDANGKPGGYAIVLSEAINKGACFHKFCVGISPEGDMLGINVVELNCPYAFAINDQRFLGQFNKCSIHNYLSCSDDINAITGATQSSDLVKEMSKRVLYLFEHFVVKN